MLQLFFSQSVFTKPKIFGLDFWISRLAFKGLSQPPIIHIVSFIRYCFLLLLYLNLKPTWTLFIFGI